MNSWFGYQDYTFELSLVDTKMFNKLLSNCALFSSLSLDCFCICENCQIYITISQNILFNLNIAKGKISSFAAVAAWKMLNTLLCTQEPLNKS